MLFRKSEGWPLLCHLQHQPITCKPSKANHPKNSRRVNHVVSNRNLGSADTIGQLPAITLQLPRQQSKHTWRCISNHITKLVHFHSPPQVHISTKPNPRAPTKIWVPNFWPTTLVHLTEKDHCRWKFGIPTSWWKFWGHQPRPQGNSSETDPLEEDWCMYVVENYWVHGKCSKFFLGGGGYHDGICTSGFQWIRNWFSDQTSCFLLTRWI